MEKWLDTLILDSIDEVFAEYRDQLQLDTLSIVSSLRSRRTADPASQSQVCLSARASQQRAGATLDDELFETKSAANMSRQSTASQRQDRFLFKRVQNTVEESKPVQSIFDKA